MASATGAKPDRAGARSVYRVPPVTVRGNDWPALEVEPVDSFIPIHPVSVVVPYYQQPLELELTLAGLERQTYPKELFEVIVVDDGSDPPLTAPASSLDLRLEYQEDLGFGLARARNRGARAARGDILLFLDCDMIPEDGWLASHARWHHAADGALTLGFRLHVDTEGLDRATIHDRAGDLAELFKDREVTRPEWIEVHMERTAELTSDDDDLFRVITGGNFGISRRFFESVGGFDESFTQWGAEDREFAYRAFTRGALLVPEREALCWHQGEGASISDQERSSLRMQFAKMSQLVAHPAYRSETSGRTFTVPEHVVTLRPVGSTEQTVFSTAATLLAGTVSDLVLWIERAPVEGSFEWLRRQLAPDPRVFFGPPGGAMDRFPISPFHIVIDCGAGYDAGMIGRLRRGLGRAAHGTALFAEGAPVTIVRSWAWHRARRAGVETSAVGRAVEFTQENTVPEDFDRLEKVITEGLGHMGTRLGVHEDHLRSVERDIAARLHRIEKLEKSQVGRLKSQAGQLKSQAGQLKSQAGQLKSQTGQLKNIARNQAKGFAGLENMISNTLFFRTRKAFFWVARVTGRVIARATAVRNRSDASDFAAWLSGAARRKISGNPVPDTPRPATPTALEPAPYTLGADIVAIGPNAGAVFAGSRRVRNTMVGDLGDPRFPYLGGRHVDLVMADSASMLESLDEAPPAGIPVISLRESAPILSVPAFDPEQVNPIGWTADHDEEVFTLGPPGAAADDPASLRRFHHVVDIAANYDGAAGRAGRLAVLAAAGVVVHLAEADLELERHLGADLYRLMTEDGVGGAGAHSREAISIAMRREALRTHSLRRRARQALTAGGIDGPDLPTVSILLPTRRPDRLAEAVATVARQRYPRLELVLGLHGKGFDGRAVAEALEGFEHPVQTVRVEAGRPLGAVLNAAVAASGGSLLAKMDDDDFYSSEHVWDLVLAREYSRAQLVAKASEYAYLSKADKTVRLAKRQGERYIKTRSVSGGVVMISRHDLDAAGGWRRMPRQVDLALAEDVLHACGAIYWTHGAGYLRVRHNDGHTWTMGDDFFLRRAASVRDGLDHEFAGL